MAGKQTGRPTPRFMTTPTRPARRPTAWLRGLVSAVIRVALLLLIIPVLWVALYRFVGPPITVLMIQGLIEGRGIDHKWAPLNRIAPSMVRAVVASEDANFCDHHGFDLAAIGAAMQHNEARPSRVRGGSTISQQTAKNVFLWPQRSWLRKGAETGFTFLIETLWGKRRIMEVYLNTIEMGPGIYGVESASERYFGVDAADLSPEQSSRLAAILPDPLKWKAVNPGPYVKRRTGRIDARSDTVARDRRAACIYDKDAESGVMAALMGETPAGGAASKPPPAPPIPVPGAQRPDEPPYPVPFDLAAPHGARKAANAASEPSVPPQSAGSDESQ